MTAGFQRWLIPGFGQAQPAQLVVAGNGPVTLVNNDTTNTVYFDNNNGVNPTRTTTAFLPPQASTSVDGKEDIYGICLAGQTADFLTFDGIVPWNNPVGVQIALNALGLAKESTQQIVKTNTANTVTTLGSPAQDGSVTGLNTGIPNNIATTGVPLLTASAQLGTNGGFTITATNQRTFPAAGAFAVKQIGYELGVSYSSTNGSVQNLTITLTWSDSTTGLITAVDTFGVFPGSAGNPHVFRISGPTKGDQVTLNFNNSGTGFTATLAYVLLQNSRYYSRDTIRTISSGQPTGITLSNFNMPENVVAQVGANVAGSGQITRTIPMYSGLVTMAANTTSKNNDMEFALIDQGANGNIIMDAFTNANGKLNIQFGMPRSGCQLIVTNNNAAAQTANVEITITPPDTL